MKRIIYIFATAALAFAVSACRGDIFDKESKSTTPVEAGTVEITISNITDNSFDVTLTPTEESAYYSYLVDNDSYDAGISASTLYSVGYSSVAAGTFKYASGSETTTFSVSATPNTTYTVYAVCGSVEGNVGEITYKTITTSDNEVPVLDVDKFEYEENQVALPFGEAVTYNEEKAVTVKVYTYASLSDSGLGSGSIAPGKSYSLEPVAEYTATVAISNNAAILTVDELKQPGAYYTVEFEEGTFVDLVGNKCAALSSSFTGGFDENDDPNVAEGSVWGHLETVTFDLGTDKIGEVFTDHTAPFKFSLPEAYLTVSNKVAVSQTVESTDGKTSITKTLTYNQDFGMMSKDTLVVNLKVAIDENENPTDLERGGHVGFSIGAGLITDIWGNTNKALEVKEILYSYGFTAEDIAGVYEVNGSSAFGPSRNEKNWYIIIEPVTVEPLEEADSEANVVITSWYGIECNIPASFDGDLGTLVMPIYYTYLNYSISSSDGGADDLVKKWYTRGYYSTKGSPYITFSTNDGNVLKGDDFIGYYYEAFNMPGSGNVEDIDEEKDYLGNAYNLFQPILTKVVLEPTASAHKAAKSAKTASFKPFKKVDGERPVISLKK